MLKKPIYSFDDETSVGLDAVPINGLVLVESTGQQFILKNKITPVLVDSNTTIADLLGNATQYITETNSILTIDHMFLQSQ